MKINRNPTKTPPIPIEGNATRPFAQLNVDFITDLPESNSKDSIMVVVDHGLTKGVILTACTKNVTANETASLLFEHVYKRFGLPDQIISDRGPQFTAQIFEELGRLLGIRLTKSTAYHPQTDGGAERVNQEVQAYLSIYCSNNVQRWTEFLHLLEFSYNQRNHADRKHSPFFLMMGYDPIAIPEGFPRTNTPYAEQRLLDLQQARREAEAAHKIAQSRMTERFNRRLPPFKTGDLVWLDSKNLKLDYP